MKKLWVDDKRTPPDDSWIWAKTYDETIAHIKTGVDIISLDHDLGEEKTGYDIAKYIEEHVVLQDMLYPDIRIHSANPVGRKNIQATIDFLNRYFEIIERINA